jgi:hypothetical protein
MLTKEEVQSLQDQVPEDLKYIFKWDDYYNTDYEDYLTEGKPDIDKIMQIHQYADSAEKGIYEVYDAYSPWNAEMFLHNVPDAIWRYTSSKPNPSD